MAIPNSKTTLKSWCKRRLGYPVVDVNVDDDQIAINRRRWMANQIVFDLGIDETCTASAQEADLAQSDVCIETPSP